MNSKDAIASKKATLNHLIFNQPKYIYFMND